MIVVKLQGGLGNQMFQYAIAKAMAKKYRTQFQLDLSFLLDRTPNKGPDFVFRDYDLDVFSIHPATTISVQTEQVYKAQPFWDKLISGCKTKTFYQEPFFSFDEKVFQLKPDLYLDGYWQSPNYFKLVEEDLRSEFTFVHSIEEQSKAILNEIQSTDSVCVNVRRGDFVNNSFHGVCDMRYFEPAIRYMTEKLANPHLFVFSDDPEWCHENFKMDVPMRVVNHQHKGYKFSNQLQLMASCKHFIIPNSTFAWWAVWLSNRKNNIVIAPVKWFNDPKVNAEDLIPKSWLRFDN